LKVEVSTNDGTFTPIEAGKIFPTGFTGKNLNPPDS
jgi:hypothetical protein